MNKKLTWILVTDGAHARVFERQQDSKKLTLIQDLTHAHDLTSEQGQSKPGRVVDSGTSAHHSYEAKTDWHDHQKELFSKELIDLFIKEHQEKKFCEAYLVCPSKIMGFLRSDILSYSNRLPSHETLKINEILKDLSNHSHIDIENYLEKSE